MGSIFYVIAEINEAFASAMHFAEPVEERNAEIKLNEMA